MGLSQSLQTDNSLDTVTIYPDFSEKLSKTLCFFFRLAWMSRFRLPAYLTILFLAADVRLSVEINMNEDDAFIDDLEI